jgi:hypothetical protein
LRAQHTCPALRLWRFPQAIALVALAVLGAARVWPAARVLEDVAADPEALDQRLLLPEGLRRVLWALRCVSRPRRDLNSFAVPCSAHTGQVIGLALMFSAVAAPALLREAGASRLGLARSAAPSLAWADAA